MRQIKVFILDDDPDAVARMVYLLKGKSELRIIASETNPESALPIIRSNRPDLIFLDIEMPGLGGFEVLEAIREKDYVPDIIFVTGYDKYAIKAIKESAQDYLLKPVDPVELDQTLQKYISKLEMKNGNIGDVEGKLTTREQDVFRLLRSGNSSKQISGVLNISKNTVDTHRRRILKKLNMKSSTEILIKYPLKAK